MSATAVHFHIGGIMNHHTAAKLGTGFHYASLNKRGGHPLGYCAEHAPHATETEARECFGQWQRDHVTLDGKLISWTDCRVCHGPTKQYASIEGDGYRLLPLCAEHLTKERAIAGLDIAGAAGDAWES
jgi:hypothetical protein